VVVVVVVGAVFGEHATKITNINIADAMKSFFMLNDLGGNETISNIRRFF